MIDGNTTLRADEASSSVSPISVRDKWSTRILLMELQKELINLKGAIEKDSYKGVNMSENRIVDICESINKLRKS